MDSLIPLLLMLLLYLVPEFFKRRKNPKEYKYPDIPDKVPQPVDMKSAQIKVKPIPTPITDYIVETPKAAWSVPPKPAMETADLLNVPCMANSASPWQGKLSPQIVQNGLIFAEILQPPRAYRPLWRRPK